jgi:uncharacterized protein (DUF2236 family)
LIGEPQDRVVEAVVGPFPHGPQLLAHTLDHQGDPGLLGPDSVSWRVIGDAAAFLRDPAPGARQLGRASVSNLRGALGSSPSWRLALVRTGTPVPAGLSRQPLPSSGGAGR